ncbi:exported hypothetical protein [Candidatus Sulfopaludibacter sp. SbA4]|nr:exported hypothetical protein [Candidatus Sulfopaludibacter sp. SbA4]
MSLRERILLVALAVWLVPDAHAQYAQQAKLVGTGGVAPTNQGYSVAISADGNTAIVGSPWDNGSAGAAWVFTRSGGTWSQQGAKLVGSGAAGNAWQGFSVAISADGNTAMVGGPFDNPWDNSSIGAAWVFTRSAGVWSQQGPKLFGADAAGTPQQGYSVALSSDGNTALVGGIEDNGGWGAAWVFTRSGKVWSQQGPKVVGTSVDGGGFQGCSVALSADGNTALVGGYFDNAQTGAAWVFARSGGVWSQQGGKLVGTDVNGTAYQGYSVALSADGNTAVVGGYNDNNGMGAVWVYTRTGGVWTQQGPKLVGSGAVGAAAQGYSVAVQGNTLVVGAEVDNTYDGAVWVYTRSGSVWTQQGGKLAGAGGTLQPSQGSAVALSADGSTMIVGGSGDHGDVGAAWVFVQPTHFAVSVPATAVAGAPFNFTVTAQDASNSAVTGYAGTVHFTSTDPSATLPADAKLTNPTTTFSATLRTAGSQTITVNDSLNTAMTGTATAIVVSIVSPPSPEGLTPAVSSGSSQILTAAFNAPGGYQALDVVNVLINTALDGRHACYLAYSRASNALYIVGDNGDSTQISGKVMDGTGSVGNSQCTVALGGSSATGSGSTLTLVLNLSFAASFVGNKVVYTAARDLAGNNSGWQTMGMHAVTPLPATFPNAVSMSPAWGNSLTQTIAFTYQDQSSAANLQTVWALINTAIDGRAACYVAYYRPGNQLYLYPDNGDGTQATSMVLTGSNTTGNSQCTISAQGASAQTSGNTLTLTLPITFKASFAGCKGVWLAAQTMGTEQTSLWQALGAEEVPGQ